MKEAGLACVCLFATIVFVHATGYYDGPYDIDAYLASRDDDAYEHPLAYKYAAEKWKLSKAGDAIYAKKAYIENELEYKKQYLRDKIDHKKDYLLDGVHDVYYGVHGVVHHLHDKKEYVDEKLRDTYDEIEARKIYIANKIREKKEKEKEYVLKAGGYLKKELKDKAQYAAGGLYAKKRYLDDGLKDKKATIAKGIYKTKGAVHAAKGAVVNKVLGKKDKIVDKIRRKKSVSP